jgi:hypothetical protein
MFQRNILHSSSGFESKASMKLERSGGLLANLFLGLLLWPGDGGLTFLKDNGELELYYTSFCPRQ